MKRGVHVSGASHESISSLLSEVAECGTHYVRLSHFSLQPVLDSSCSKGLVFQVRPHLTLLRVPGCCMQACPGVKGSFASEPFKFNGESPELSAIGGWGGCGAHNPRRRGRTSPSLSPAHFLAPLIPPPPSPTPPLSSPVTLDPS